MAESKSDFAKLAPEQRQALAKKYAQRLINASHGSPTALDNFGKLGTYRTDEEEFESVGKALLNIRDSAFTKLVDDQLRQISDPKGRYESKGLRDLITSEFSLGGEDKMLNLFGLPTDSLFGESLQAQSVEDPSVPDYDKFGSGGFIPSSEYSPEEAITSEEEGTGSIEDRYQVEVLNKTPEEVRKEAGAKAAEAPNLDDPAPKKTLDEPKGAAAQVEEGPNLDNPAGLAAMADNLGRGVRDPKIKNIPAIQRRNMEKSLNALASRKIDEDIAKQRRADRTQKIFDDREADLKESWARSRTGRMDGRSWDQLDEDTKLEMRGRFMDARANSAYTDEKYKKLKGFTFDEEGNPTNAPIFDRDGLVGFKTLPQMEKEMGGESVKVDPRTEGQKREDRIIDEIDQEIKETGQHPFGEDPVLGTNYRQEVRNRENYGPGYKQLKDQSLDLLDNPEVQKSIPSAPSIPMAPTTKPSMPASYNRSIVSPDMLAKNRQDVNDVLDSVPMPEMPKKSLAPVKSSPYNYTHRRTLEYPTEPSQSGLVNSTKEYPTFSLETPAEPGPELTRTTKEYPTEPTQQSLVERTLEYPVKTPEGAQQRKQTPGYGRSGKKQFNIPALDFLDLTNYTYNEPSYEQTQRPGFGRSGKKQFNLKFLDRFDPRNYSYKQ
jgi:hypothetical protein